MRVVLATANPGKQREFAALLAPLDIQLLLQSELGIDSAEETGATFEANALLKARHAARLSGLPALADDSGLEVDALNGRPGVHSARYAGPQASDAANNDQLLREMSAVPDDRRQARYRCVLALVHSADDAHPLLVHGEWAGRIARVPSGDGGFGYDPLFVPQGMSITSAQLAPAEKNRISHRGAALRALVAAMASWR
jgi:XTP/dITP diphosphohydrolase